MEETPKIDLIKKCKQDSQTLSLQETDDAIRVQLNGCSTFLSETGILAQGEFWNSKSRNALVTFRDPASAEVKGK